MFQNPTAGAVEEVRHRVLLWVYCVIEGGQVSACVFQIGFGWTPGKSKSFWFCWMLQFWDILRAELLIWGQLKFRVYKRHDSFLISCLSAKERSSQWVNPAKRHICNQTQRERDKEKTFFLFMTGHSKRKMHKVIRYKPKDPFSWFYVSLQRWNSFR